MGRYERPGSLAMIRQPVQEKENSEFKQTLLRFKITKCHVLTMAERLGIYIQPY